MPAPPQPQDLEALSAHAPAVAALVAGIASDLAVVIDSEGRVSSVAEGDAALAGSTAAWVGRRWVETATPDTQRKLQLLLEEARQGGSTRRREVNHPGPGGSDIPMAWSAIRLGEHGPVVAVGRDLRAVAAIQQRFMAAQQDLERDYWRRRETEARFQRLFQVASDAVLVIDAASHEVLEFNEAARRLFAATLGQGRGAAAGGWPAALPPLARAAVAELLVSAATSGKAAEMRVRALEGGVATCVMAATPFRVGDRLQLLVRARADAPSPAGGEDVAHMARFVESTPDAVVITDSSGRVQLANPAFISLVDAGEELRLRGRSVMELAGDREGRWRGLLEGARLHGVAQAEGLHLRGPGGADSEVRAHAALLTDGEQEAVGWVLQVVAPAEASGSVSGIAQGAAWAEVARCLSDGAARLGRVPMEQLLSEVSDAAERHLLQRARALSNGHVDDWAALLGETTEGLRARLRRLGLDDEAQPASPAGGPAGRPGTRH